MPFILNFLNQFKNTSKLLQLSVLIVFLFISSCIPIWERLTTEDLLDIQERGKLQVITAYGANSYFIYKGEPMGYEYELVKRLADHLNLELEMIVSHDIENVPFLLNSGTGDLVAANIAVTGERVREIQFTEPLMLTRQVLVQKTHSLRTSNNTTLSSVDSLLNKTAVSDTSSQKDAQKDKEKPLIEKPAPEAKFLKDATSILAGEVQSNIINKPKNKRVNNPIELLNKTVHVRRGSPFYQRLKHLEKEMGGKIDIHTVPGNIITEDLIRQVYLGKIDYTIADEPTALTNKAYYNNLDVSTPIGFSQRIAWVVRPNSTELLKEINKWIRKIKSNGTLVTIHRRYYRNPRAFRSRVDSQFYSEHGESISIYDNQVKAIAKKVGWDWRLLSALIYQESRFNPRAKSWAGASGLMQLMPATGRSLGVKNLFSPAENLKGGSKFLAQLDKRWENKIKDKGERLNFVLASYNAGPGHVEDARYLAKYYGKDPNVWNKNVAEYMLKLSDPKFFGLKGVRYGYCRGQEPFNYVTEIRGRYNNYKKFFKSQKELEEKEAIKPNSE